MTARVYDQFVEVLYLNKPPARVFDQFVEILMTNNIDKQYPLYLVRSTGPNSTYVPPYETDPFWNNVSLYLSMNGDNGSTTIQEYTGKTITNVNGVTLTDQSSKFSGTSAYFNGSNYLEITNTGDDFIFSKNFTIEFWINHNMTSQSDNEYKPGIMSLDRAGLTDTSLNRAWSINTATFDRTEFEFNYLTSLTRTFTQPYPKNTWDHIAFVRNGSNLTTYLNGIAKTAASVSYSSNLIGLYGRTLRIGYNKDTDDYFTGYLSEIRITKDLARYTSNFTPPTTRFWTPT